MTNPADVPSGGEGVPRLFGLTLVKDEADIIRFCLQHASRFCEKIFVLDNGSTDGTWEIVRRLGEEGDVVQSVGREPGPYGEGLKALIFQRARRHFLQGDWVLLLDSDEFLERDPGPLLRSCETEGANLVRCLQAQFFVTERDLDAEWFLDAGQVESFGQLPRHYRIDWEEVRFFRFSPSLRWPVRGKGGNLSRRSYPLGLGVVSSRRIVNRHYQYRSQAQMEKRLESRAREHERTGWFSHNVDPDWTNYIQNAQDLDRVDPGDVIRATWRDRVRVWYRRKRREIPRRLARALSRRLPRWPPWRSGGNGDS